MTDEVIWAKPFASGHTRAQWARYLLATCIAMDFVAVGAGYMNIELFSRIAAGEDVTREEIFTIAVLQLGTMLLRFFVFLATVVLFLRWLHRAYSNLPALGVRHPEYSPRWAVGCFFVPYINLVRPYQIVGEIWRAGEPDSVEDDATQFHFIQARSRSTPLIVKAWWRLYIAAGVAGYLAWCLSWGGNNSAADLVALNWIIEAAYFFNLLAAILAILVIKNIDQMQEEKHQRLLAASAQLNFE